MLHEAVEHFLAKAYGVALTVSGRPVSRASKFRESETKDGGKPTPKGTPQYYAAYARWASKREISEALTYLTTTVEWSDIHRGERFGVNYDQLVRALAYCRHTIVHGFGRLPNDKPSKTPAYCWSVANQLARPRVHGSGLSILPEAAHTTKLINEVSSFAFATYTAFSETYGFTIDYTPTSL